MLNYVEFGVCWNWAHNFLDNCAKFKCSKNVYSDAISQKNISLILLARQKWFLAHFIFINFAPPVFLCWYFWIDLLRLVQNFTYWQIFCTMQLFCSFVLSCFNGLLRLLKGFFADWLRYMYKLYFPKAWTVPSVMWHFSRRSENFKN